MYRSITRRFSTALVAGAAAAGLTLVVLAGPGLATPETDAPALCESTCLTAEGSFGATIPVPLDPQSARDLAGIVEGDRGRTGSAGMRLMSAPEGAEVELVETDGRIAEVRLLDGPAAGRIGYVPTGWVSGS